MNNKDNRTAKPFYGKDSASELVLIGNDNHNKDSESIEQDYNKSKIIYVLTEKGRRLGEKLRQARDKAISDFFWDEFLKENPTTEEQLKKLIKKPEA